MRRLCIMLALVAMLSGCFTMRSHLPGTLRGDVSDKIEKIGTFDISVTHTFLLHGLIGRTEEEALASALREEVRKAGADGVANVELEIGFGLRGVAIAVATASILHPRTYRMRGDLVRIHAPVVPGQSLDAAMP